MINIGRFSIIHRHSVSSLKDSSVWLKKIECRIHCCHQSVQSTEIYPAQMEKVDNLKKGLCQKGLEVKMSRHLQLQL